jgi:hypothetical protein
MAPIGEVLSELGVTDWDVLIVGDGSGVGWDRGCAWASVLIEHYSMRRAVFKGVWDPGTVGIAELSAYFHALVAYASGPGKTRLHDLLQSRSDARVQVHVITDNETIVRQGLGVYSRKANAPVWAGIDYVVSTGYRVHWHFLKRDRLGLNQLVDHLSRECRKAVEAIQPPPGTGPYDYNPDDVENFKKSEGTRDA